MGGPTFPDFPDNPEPGGQGGGGDHVPPYVPRKQWFLDLPVIVDARISKGHVRFRFLGNRGPIMRYNIIWSRPGKEETDMRWVDPEQTPTFEDYFISELPLPDTEYTFKVQAQGRDKRYQFNGPNNPYLFDYDRTPFVEETFHTPPAPSFIDRHEFIEMINDLIGRVARLEEADALTTTGDNPFRDRVDEQVEVIPHPIPEE